MNEQLSPCALVLQILAFITQPTIAQLEFWQSIKSSNVFTGTGMNLEPFANENLVVINILVAILFSLKMWPGFPVFIIILESSTAKQS